MHSWKFAFASNHDVLGPTHPTVSRLPTSTSPMLKAWASHATPRSRDIVRQVLSSSGKFGMTSQEIYEASHKQFPDDNVPAPPMAGILPGQKGRFGRPPQAPPEPPMRNHPIRSVRYLKKIVLEDLMASGEVEKVFVRRGAGGKDGAGSTLDLVVRRGHGRMSLALDCPAAEEWLWRLLPTKPESIVNSEPTPENIYPKAELECDENLASLSNAWKESTLEFKNLSPHRLRQRLEELEREGK